MPRENVRRWHRLAVVGLVVLAGSLATVALFADAPTFDEPFHLATGVACLRTGDFRLTPDHPPLARMWVAWPILLTDYHWPGPEHAAWCSTSGANFGVDWMFRLNDALPLLRIGRGMMVILLLATCLTTYALARRLFGDGAGLVALALAALSPTLLAHGHLITTDLPIALCTTLALLTFGRALERTTWRRVIAAAVAVAAASVTKMSWPLVVPALVVMGGWWVLRRPASAAAGGGPATSGSGLPPRRRDRAGLVLGMGLLIGLVTWVGIWACYQGRRTVLAPLRPEEDTPAARAGLKEAEQHILWGWTMVLYEPDGSPRPGLVPAFLLWAAEHAVLPEGYIYGLARTLLFSSGRLAYLTGGYSDAGWWYYFPVAAAIKTPLATLLLLAAGTAALVVRRVRSRDPILLAGLIVFVVVYGGFMMRGAVNIGHRHLLPLYPVFFVLASAAVGWAASRLGRVLVGGALVWLLAENLWFCPQYLPYFNELIGGPANGYRYLADSNVDWGQDLGRLADYARRHPGESLKLAYFGSALPPQFVECTALPSHFDFSPRAELSAGTYVASVTQLLGVYDEEIRADFWTPVHRAAYATLAEMASAPVAADETVEETERRTLVATEYEDLRYKRLLSRLPERRPDDRIGYSMLLWRLSDADVEELTRP